MRKRVIHVIAFCFILFISIGAVQNPFSIAYIDSLKNESLTVMKRQDTLFEQIEQKAQEYEEQAIDARIDRVWKAVPGYNGLMVDVEASYDKMKKLEIFDSKKLVFKEIKPEVVLDDLPPSPIYKGNEEKPMVTFLVNVAWGNEFLPDILKTLKEYDIHTTFFLDGSWVKNNPNLAMMLYEEGHEIGNHAYSHPNMSKLTIDRIDEEIIRTNQVIEATIDVKPKWFAPPSGDYNQTVVEQAAKQGMKTVLWTADTIDWRKPEPSEMVERVLSKVHNGTMILMHPTDSTARGLESLIIGVQEKGYKIGTVSELLSEERMLELTRGMKIDK